MEEAVRLGADAVVLFTALGGDTEAGMLRTLAGIGAECAAMGMPLIAEAEFPTTYAAVEQLKGSTASVPAAQRPACAERGRHRQDELARRRRLVRPPGRGGRRHP